MPGVGRTGVQAGKQDHCQKALHAKARQQRHHPANAQDGTEALERNPELVNHFYNERRKQLYEAQPNAGHKGLAGLENYFDVRIITQNIDDLHERAGSTNVLHLHGELKKVRSSRNPDLIYDLDGWELKLGTKAEDGSILRPHIVWFGESVPNIEPAIELVQQADILVIIGTSLAVSRIKPFHVKFK